MSSSLAIFHNTLRHAANVRGFTRAPPSSLIARKSEWESDMFRLRIDSHELLPTSRKHPSLQDYHYAFLTSPVFSTELSILKRMGVADPSTILRPHLREVAKGRKRSVGPWTVLHRETTARDDNNSKNSVSTLIMRSYIPDHGPFCDTWWSLEEEEAGCYDLVFGTALLFVDKESAPLSIRISMPFHRMYSRLLLASAKENLLRTFGTGDGL